MSMKTNMKTLLHISIATLAVVILAILMIRASDKQTEVRCNQLEQQSLEHPGHYYSQQENINCK